MRTTRDATGAVELTIDAVELSTNAARGATEAASGLATRVGRAVSDAASVAAANITSTTYKATDELSKSIEAHLRPRARCCRGRGRTRVDGLIVRIADAATIATGGSVSAQWYRRYHSPGLCSLLVPFALLIATLAVGIQPLFQYKKGVNILQEFIIQLPNAFNEVPLPPAPPAAPPPPRSPPSPPAPPSPPPTRAAHPRRGHYHRTSPRL